MADKDLVHCVHQASFSCERIMTHEVTSQSHRGRLLMAAEQGDYKLTTPEVAILQLFTRLPHFLNSVGLNYFCGNLSELAAILTAIVSLVGAIKVRCENVQNQCTN